MPPGPELLLVAAFWRRAHGLRSAVRLPAAAIEKCLCLVKTDACRHVADA
jgi:hypothetical protein